MTQSEDSRVFRPQFALAIALTEDWSYDANGQIVLIGQVVVGGERLGLTIGCPARIVFAAARTDSIERTLTKSNVGVADVVLVERVMFQNHVLVAEWVRTVSSGGTDGRSVKTGYAGSPALKVRNVAWQIGEPESIRWPLCVDTLDFTDPTGACRTFDRTWLARKVSLAAEIADTAGRELKMAQRRRDADAQKLAQERVASSRITVTIDMTYPDRAVQVTDTASLRAALESALNANMGFAVLRCAGVSSRRIAKKPGEVTSAAVLRTAMDVTQFLAGIGGGRLVELIPGQVIAAQPRMKETVVSECRLGNGMRLTEAARVWTDQQLALVAVPVQELTKTAPGVFQMISMPVPMEPERFSIEGMPTVGFEGLNLKSLPFTEDSGFRGQTIAMAA